MSEPKCGALYKFDGEKCDRELGHDGFHCNNHPLVWMDWNDSDCVPGTFVPWVETE